VASPDEIFWKTVEGWRSRQARIEIACTQQPYEHAVLGTVADFTTGVSVTFRDTKTEEELPPMDFRRAEIRFHGTEKLALSSSPQY
jgi:hypothetical protein